MRFSITFSCMTSGAQNRRPIPECFAWMAQDCGGNERETERRVRRRMKGKR